MAHRSSDVTVSHEARFRVRYAETDQMGIVYYANYYIWMEIGRVEYCRAQGVRYREMEERDHVLLTVAESSCRYHSPAKYDDEVAIKTWISQAHPRMITFSYEMRCAEDERKLAAGFSKHIFCGRDLRPTRLPEHWWTQFGIKPA